MFSLDVHLQIVQLEKDELEETVDYALLQRVLNNHIKEGETIQLFLS